MNTLGIYIHIPFCKQKCLYCDFLSFPEGREQQALYFDALKKEIELSAGECRDYLVDSVFIGGGTPTSVEPSYITGIMELLKRDYNLAEDAEITIECNPGTADYKALRAYRDAGINRISIGLQSAKDDELLTLGRIHNKKQFLECYENAIQAGFTNINVDLMSALPGQTLRDWESNLEFVCGLDPAPCHVSAYSLIIEEGTPFYEMYGEEKENNSDYDADAEDSSGVSKSNCGKPLLPLPDEDTEREMYHRSREILEKHGYSHYEISNYSKPGCECRHNVRYWECGDYIGFGLGAASLMKGVRYRNVPELSKYLEAVNSIGAQKNAMQDTGADSSDIYELMKDVRTEVQALSKNEQIEEFMFLGLRMVRGVKADEFRSRFSCDMYDIYADVIAELRGDELLAVGEDGISLTDYGMDLSNYCMAKFLM